MKRFIQNYTAASQWMNGGAGEDTATGIASDAVTKKETMKLTLVTFNGETTQMKCVVCGADVAKSRIRRDEIIGRGMDTCSPVCTRAKYSGRTRQEQFWADDAEEIQQEKNNALNKPV